MKIDVQIESPDLASRRVVLADGEHSLGAGESHGTGHCSVTLAYPTVSRRHGVIKISEGLVSYTDLSSRNGSRLHCGDRHVNAIPGVALDWGRGVALEIGPFTLRWQPSGEPLNQESCLARHAQTYARLLTERPQNAREVFYDLLAEDPDRETIVEAVYREFHGSGPLHEWLHDPACREILVNAHDQIFVDRGNGVQLTRKSFLSPESYAAWASRVAHESGRRLDNQNPICEATLAGGARFHAVLPPVSARSLSVSIRRFGSAPVTEDQALGSGWLAPPALALLRRAVEGRKNIVISGGTSTGKTSLLNFLCGYLSPDDRVITVEDTIELAPTLGNLVQLQARGTNADGVGGVTLRQLLQCALRMRPDRIIVGECRGPEVLDMLQALNTGHPGSLTTVHANSSMEALRRLELLALLGASNVSVDCIREWIGSTVDVIVQLVRRPDGRRQVAQISVCREDRSEFEAAYVANDR